MLSFSYRSSNGGTAAEVVEAIETYSGEGGFAVNRLSGFDDALDDALDCWGDGRFGLANDPYKGICGLEVNILGGCAGDSYEWASVKFDIPLRTDDVFMFGISDEIELFECSDGVDEWIEGVGAAAAAIPRPTPTYIGRVGNGWTGAAGTKGTGSGVRVCINGV